MFIGKMVSPITFNSIRAFSKCQGAEQCRSGKKGASAIDLGLHWLHPVKNHVCSVPMPWTVNSKERTKSVQVACQHALSVKCGAWSLLYLQVPAFAGTHEYHEWWRTAALMVLDAEEDWRHASCVSYVRGSLRLEVAVKLLKQGQIGTKHQPLQCRRRFHLWHSPGQTEDYP